MQRIPLRIHISKIVRMNVCEQQVNCSCEWRKPACGPTLLRAAVRLAVVRYSTPSLHPPASAELSCEEMLYINTIVGDILIINFSIARRPCQGLPSDWIGVYFEGDGRNGG